MKPLDMGNNDMTGSPISNHLHDASETAKDAVKTAARDAAKDAQNDVVDQTEQSADAAHRAANAFDAGSLQALVLGQLAQGLDGFSQTLCERSVDGLADDVAVFARQNPLMFLGGAALVGFAAARFLKAPSQDTRAFADPLENRLSTQDGEA
jgi:hypothetical protein